MAGEVIQMPNSSGMVRDVPEPAEARAAHVKEWQEKVVAAKAHWKPAFDRMRRNMKFASGKQWPDEGEEDDRYKANIVQRVLKTSVAAAYAKNPTFIQSRRRKLDFKLWDGKPETMIAAMTQVQQAQSFFVGAASGQPPQDPMAMPPPPPDPVQLQAAMELVQDIAQGTQRREMIKKIGETLECLAEYFLTEQKPGFKLQMKQMVRRARTTCVGYVQLGFQRMMQLSEDQNRQLEDHAQRLATIGQLQADLQDGEIDPYCAEVDKLNAAVAAIRSQPEQIVREGIVYSFPRSTRIIPSLNTEALMGWVGTDWLAEEVMMTSARIKQVYGIDVGKSYTAYRADKATPTTGAYRKAGSGKDGLACVWRIFDKETGLELTVCEGYPDFLKEPAAPDVFIEQFFPYFALVFNQGEDESELFPKSDVELMTPIQREYNRSKEALRQHRIAARPLYLAPSGAFEKDEKETLAGHAAHDVIEIQALDKGQKAADVIMPMQKIGVDPNLYETNGLFEDLQRVTGNQEAVLGSVGNGTATGQNIAETARQGTMGLDTDEMDEMLTALASATGQVMLSELNEETVIEICGPGAVWPKLSKLEIMKELNLETKAGSTGRPDQAREAATFERLAPTLLQIPGVMPRWLAERAIRLLDDDTDITDAVIDGIPSIMAQNRMSQVQPGDPSAQPDQQGGEGGDKNRAQKPGGGDSDSYPGPGAGGA